MQSVFNFGMGIYEKIEKSIHESKFVHQTIIKSWKDFFPINFLNFKINFFFFIDHYTWFHIIGNYTSAKINHNERIDCPKYLNKNQALFRREIQMRAESYLVYEILGIQATWKNWTQIPQISWDKQRILLVSNSTFSIW